MTASTTHAKHATHTTRDEPATLPLEALHRELGARLGPFAGWRMPVQYPAGVRTEHLQVRAHAGLFDVSHMGQLRVTGPGLDLRRFAAAIEAALPVDLAGWPPGRQRYVVLTDEDGGIEDDLMAVALFVDPAGTDPAGAADSVRTLGGDPATPELRLVVNAGNRDRDLGLLRTRCPTLAFDWVDAALLALQGPDAEDVLSALDPAAAAMRFLDARMLDLDGAACFTMRSGYTGEDGYEISVPVADAERVARRLLDDARVAPIGLGARDTLRLEAGLPLHGADIGPSTTPVEAGLAFAIPASRRCGGAKAGGFPGAATILAQMDAPPARRLVGLRSDENVPIRAQAEVLDASGRTIGHVTSGTVSPTLGCPIALAMVEAGAAAVGTRLAAMVRDRRPAVTVVPLPFVPKRYRR